MFRFVFVFAFFCTVDVFSFCRFLRLFYNCYTVSMFTLLVANWPFCINEFEITFIVLMCLLVSLGTAYVKHLLTLLYSFYPGYVF